MYDKNLKISVNVTLPYREERPACQPEKDFFCSTMPFGEMDSSLAGIARGYGLFFLKF
jgi:hypothetical protein